MNTFSMIYGNEIPIASIDEPIRCYCITPSGFVYDIYDYRFVRPDNPSIHLFPSASRLILVKKGRALCDDSGKEIKVGMFIQ